MRKSKLCSESYVSTTNIVLPNDTNMLNNLMGGHLMHWLDVAGAICAKRFCGRVVVTASADNISFNHPIPLSAIVTMEATVTRSFYSSMEVHIVTWIETNSPQRIKTNEAFLTFVAVDQNGNTIEVPDAVPTSEEEKKLFEGALRRRQLRLILAGRMKPDDATELKALFEASTNNA